MTDEETWLGPGEVLHWEGRPAPRCWTFRNWRHSLIGTVVLGISLWWLQLGRVLAAESGLLWTALLPWPLVLTGAWLSFGHLLWARIEWGRVRYLLTNRRFVVGRGVMHQVRKELLLEDLRYCTLVRLGEQLAHVRLADCRGDWLTLSCVEYPQRLLPWVEAAIAANSAESAALEEGKGFDRSGPLSLE